MQFTSKKARSYRFVVEPRDSYQEPGRPVRKIVGCAATFVNHTFDSDAAAKSLKWSDDTKHLVEATLLLSNDFGRRFSGIQESIWLIPKGPVVDVNVDISDELEAFYPGLRQEVAEKLGIDGNELAPVEPTCVHFIVNSEGQRQCKNNAIKDSIYCGKHVKQHTMDLSADELRAETEAELV